ncbi:MAG TPA: response regulator [Candidatus Binatia bacterium]|nr:response regulator [Candidatus Binatia bacterium]
MSTNRTTILCVDDDVGFLDVVRNLMLTLSEDTWEVLVAPDAAQALGLIHEHKIDLLVIDVRMPVMDGLQFLALLHRNYPSLLKVALTGHTTETYRAACLSNGAELFLEKPVSREGWKNLYSTLKQLVRLQPEEGFRGMLRRVGLQDVLQMECLARSSSVLEISTTDARGSVFVQDGQIVHAQVGNLAGEEAFNHLMGLAGGNFNLKPFSEPPARTISGSWEHLLMEAARLRDEAQEPSLNPSALGAGESTTASAGIEGILGWAPSVAAQAIGGVGGAESVPGPSIAPAPAERLRPKIDEVLICSTKGDVLYEWQCPDTNARIRFLQFLSQKSWQLRQGLPVGHFQRLEVEGPGDRIVTHIDADSALYVRSSHLPAETSS